ncbi:MAG: AAA family ATPase [Deltaproteobacteria bacterium]|nr:AAA family ATPase [Deltaproteobacteria bacterium]MBL7216978.1 AAA family ATPase [Desulfobacteraceae bacterium]
MIDKLKLTDFTVFKALEIDFSSKINVIIGENATGKTHLLKAAYALCSANNALKGKREVEDSELTDALSEKLVNVFKPIENKLGKLRSRGPSGDSCFSARFIDKQISASFHTNSTSIKDVSSKEYENYGWEPVFIPTKEVLSFMEGFVSLYNKYRLSFDQTYYDICSLLDLPVIHTDQLDEKSNWAMDEIKKTIGGKFIFHGGGRVTFIVGKNELSVNDTAEGFRKAGILYRLLEVGAIRPGVSGTLFWDEPEANLNPNLMKLLVEILLELSRKGQQIILATHDYVLLKWFDLLMDRSRDDHVRFHALYFDEESGEVKLQSTDDYLQIAPNVIDEVYAELINEDIDRSMGGLGK